VSKFCSEDTLLGDADVESLVLPMSHHWHSGSPDRHLLRDAMVDWIVRKVSA
jgi:hypothetical protein